MGRVSVAHICSGFDNRKSPFLYSVQAFKRFSAIDNITGEKFVFCSNDVINKNVMC